MPADPPPRPQRAGELRLVPDVPRQIRKITVEIEQLPDGILRFTQPKTPGWVAAGRSPIEVVRALRSAFTERQVFAHADWKGTVYDHPATPQHRRHKPVSRGRRRCDVYAADQWMIDERGLWVSPGKGHRYPESTAVVQKVIKARRAMGLPDRPGPNDYRHRMEQITGTQQALDLGTPDEPS
jgi:hypothetical protein